MHQDHLSEILQVEEAEEVEAEGEHFHYPGKHLPMLLKSSLEMHQLFLQGTTPKSIPSSRNGSYTAA